MTDYETSQQALKSIESNIARYGQHVYGVGMGAMPKYCYTIGLSQTPLRAELVIPGAVLLTIENALDVLNELSEVAHAGGLDPSESCAASDVGVVRFRAAHTSWTQRLLLGATHYYSSESVTAFQVFLRPDLVTIDVPDLSREWDPELEPVWRWLELPWTYEIPKATAVVTNLRALRGDAITEVCHWEDDEWELMAADDMAISKSDLHVVAFGTLLAVDPSLEDVLSLPRGRALRRVNRWTAWEPWE